MDKNMFLVLLFVGFSSCINVLPFSADKAYQQLLYSYASYCDARALRPWDCYWCQKAPISEFQVFNVTHDAQTNMQAFVGYDEANKAIQLTFRGTQAISIKDWITDFTASHQVPYPKNPDVFVHHGFYKAYQSIQSSVRDAVREAVKIKGAANFYVAGHSLGGALAIICAIDLMEDGLIPLDLNYQLYTFGAPRVGDKAFTTYFDAIVNTSYRIVNNHDIVPHVPLQKMGFRHTPQEVWYKGTDYTICSEDNTEDPKCSNSVFPLLWSIPNHISYLNVHLIECVLG